MAIAAKRFTFAGEETNLPVADLISNASNEIYSSVNLEVKELSEEFKAFLETNKELSDLASKVKDGTAVATDLAKDAVRTAKGAMGTLKDLTGLNTKALDKLIAGTLPNNQLAQNAFNQLSTKCKNNALGFGGLGKPYDPSMNCNGKKNSANKGSCNSSQFGNVLSKLTGGAYNSSYSDLNSVLSNLMALSNYGYNMNMCGVFGALSSGITDKGLLSKAAGGLLGNLSSKGNVLGSLDVANSSAGLTPLFTVPDGISEFFDNFSKPKEITERLYSGFMDRVDGGMELLKDGWKSSGLGDMFSTAEMAISDGLNDLMSSKVTDFSIDLDNLNAIPDADMTFIGSAYLGGPNIDNMSDNLTEMYFV